MKKTLVFAAALALCLLMASCSLGDISRPAVTTVIGTALNSEVPTAFITVKDTTGNICTLNLNYVSHIRANQYTKIYECFITGIDGYISLSRDEASKIYDAIGVEMPYMADPLDLPR